ncbi:MAG: carbon monoxide dehydrogenase [Novosphingobium sp.]|nr:carbon monoxide dehydrogenase [Novosphingobium sp.]
MRMTGEQRIAAPRARVWAALNDPEVLRQCIPGCQSLVKEADDKMRATVEIKIGPIGAKFDGAVTLSDLNPPESYTITGQGQGGTVGTAKGGAKVRLAEAGDETVLSYEVDAEVGGRLAQLGGPIIDATAKQLAAKFFRQFAEVVAAPAVVPVAEVASSTGVTASTSPMTAPLPLPTPASAAASGAPWAWIATVVLALLAGFYLGLSQVGLGWLLIVIILLIVAAGAGYETGRRGGARK